MAPKQTVRERDEQQRDLVRSIDQTQREVILPSMKRMETMLMTIDQKEYLPRAEADNKYMTKADFLPYKVILGTIGSVMLGAIALALTKGFLK